MDPQHQLFQAALGLQSPWIVKSIEFSQAEGTLRLALDFEPGARFADPADSSTLCPVHDSRERTWRHLDFFQHRTELTARVPRITCADGKVRQLEVPWARPGSGFTLLFEALVMTLCREMSVEAVARLVGEHDTRLWRIIHHYVEKAWEGSDWRQVERISIDELSTRKHHTYATAFVEVRGGEAVDEPPYARLLYLTPGKDAETVARFVAQCEQRGLEAGQQIKEAAIDMSAAFIKGIGEHLPTAAICFDRFHVMKLCGEAVDQVRKEVAAICGGLPRGALWSLRGNAERLSHSAARLREDLMREHREIGRAMALREYLQDLWRYAARDLAEGHLNSFCTWAQRSRLKPFVRLARTLRRHWDGILNYFNHFATSALIESMNSRLQLARRRARGYRNFRNFRAIAYWIAGDLNVGTLSTAHTR